MLREFFAWALDGDTRERYLSLSASKSTRWRRKLLEDLPHSFGCCRRVQVPRLPDRAWQIASFAFGGGAEFGEWFPSMRAALDVLEPGDSWLVISDDAAFAIFEPEHYPGQQRELVARPK